uniref:Uncharacterized protein n=1 Tax=Sorghum bicolor TaxID=4558 RepID=C6JS73_SORBI
MSTEVFMALHDLLLSNNLHDKEFERCDADDEYLVEEDDTTPEDETEDAENEDAMNIIRSRIADALFSVR